MSQIALTSRASLDVKVNSLEYLDSRVWPDIGIKVAPKSLKVATAIFTLKVMCFKIAPKVIKYLAYFCKEFCHL